MRISLFSLFGFIAISLPAFTQLSGTYSINQSALASSTNFTSFQAFADSLASQGVSGPVVADVVASTGPYVQQVEFNTITGVSASNTITVNGNGNTIIYNPPSLNRYIIRFHNTQYVLVDNLIIKSDTASITTWAVWISGSSSYNKVSNCEIYVSKSDYHYHFFTCVTIGNDATDLRLESGANNNVVENNFISGGYFGIHYQLYSSTEGNHIRKNTIVNFADAGIFISGGRFTNIDSNEIYRTSRDTMFRFIGIHLEFPNGYFRVMNNRIHNANDTNPNHSAIGILAKYNTILASQEHYYYNNAIYNLNSTGYVFGFWIFEADGHYLYNNTIALEDERSVNSKAFGIALERTCENIRVKNNVIRIKNNSNDYANCLFIGSLTSTVQSDSNLFFTENVGSGPAYIGSHGLNFHDSLASWQTAGGGIFDQHSYEKDPFFISNTYVKPTNYLVDDKAAPNFINKDIEGITRKALTPDVGAYEFEGLNRDVAVVKMILDTSLCGDTVMDVGTVYRNNGFDTLYNVPVEFNITGPLGTAHFFDTIAVFYPNVSDTIYYNQLNIKMGGSFDLIAYSTLTTDQESRNDTIKKINFVIPAVPPKAADTIVVICEGEPYLLVLPKVSGYENRWYASATDLLPFFVGDSLNLSLTNVDTVFYVRRSYTGLLCESELSTIHVIGANTITYETINPVECEAYTTPSGKAIYTTSGNYMDTIPNHLGCDSVITINLTINNTFHSFSTVVCDSLISPSGKVLYNSGIYEDTIMNAAGCDSLMVINLTVNYTAHTAFIETTCNEYNWRGTQYTASGVYSDTLVSIAGCDSVLTLDLTLNYSSTYALKDTACDKYEWLGNTYTGSGTYFDTLVNSVGCDSLLTLELVIYSFSDSVTQLSTVMTAVADDLEYQWITCDSSNSIIAGATGQSYTATENGHYAVIMDLNGCIDTSRCVEVNSVGIANLGRQEGIRIYPNPTSGKLTLNFENAAVNRQITLRNLSGQIMNQKTFNSGGNLHLEIDGPAGIYLLSISDAVGNRRVFRVVKW
jgi:hypothetical protein